MKVIFMGTPDFSVLALQKLAETNEVLAVFTQPDRERGRGKKVQMTAVKKAALALDLPVYQYDNINSAEALELIASFNADVIVVAAFGQILKNELLNLTPYGCINIHASKLPRWRGASPIQTAIASGDKLSGVTIMQMDKGLDTGAILKIKEQIIDEAMTGGELHDALMEKGADAIVESLAELEAGTLSAEAQDDSLSTYAPLITKQMMNIDWSKDAKEIVDLIRAYNPFPTAYSYYLGKRVKIYRAQLIDDATCADDNIKCGQIVAINKDNFVVQTGMGQVAITEVQFAASKKMPVSAYLLGHTLELASVLSDA